METDNTQTAFEEAARADERRIIRRAAWTRLWYIVIGLVLALAFLASFGAGVFVGARFDRDGRRGPDFRDVPEGGGIWLPLPKDFHARLGDGKFDGERRATTTAPKAEEPQKKG